MSDRSALAAIVETFARFKVLCVGDVILDHFLYGKVERISPEAPIPVLLLAGTEDTMLGGAGNVVRNIKALGAQARFVTVVGDDREGEEIARQLSDELGMADRPIVDDGRRTSTKTRYIANVQQILRADREDAFPLSPEIREKLIGAVMDAIPDCDVVILSDYGKGVLDNRVAAEIIAAAGKAEKSVIVDPKGSDYEIYRGADIITPNRRELTEATRMPTDSIDKVVSAAQYLIDEYGFGFVLATLGGEGMVLVTASGDVHQLGAEAREVYDVSGAGDTVAAVLAVALVGGGLLNAALLANVAAGIVVGKVGTAVAYADDITHALLHCDISSAEAKVMSLRSALDRIETWRRDGLRVGFTNGCFDLLHPGHVSLLSQAKNVCDRLVVGLNSDSSIRRLKGDGRPVQSEAARAQVLASLANVDMVIIFSDDTPIELIGAIKPEILIKGADYAIEQVVGADLVHGYGGKIILARLEDGHSTTATIARINK